MKRQGRYSSNDRHYLWKGDKAGYDAIHAWIIRHKGPAVRCEDNPSHIGRNYQWANINGEYKRDFSDYKQLCIECHHRMDYQRMYGNKCKMGHEMTIENTYIRPDNQNAKQCRTCRSIYQRRHIIKKQGLLNDAISK